MTDEPGVPRPAGARREVAAAPSFLQLLHLLPGIRLRLCMIGPDVPEALHGSGLRCTADEKGSVPAGEQPGYHLQPFQFPEHGPGISPEQDEACSESKEPAFSASIDADKDATMEISFWGGAYHDVLAGPSGAYLGPPDFIVASNAGLPAYGSWVDTLRYAAGLQAAAGAAVPFICSDFCEEAAVVSRRMMAAVLERDERGLQFDLEANPFRCPLRRWEAGNALPAYSNGFTFGFLCGDVRSNVTKC